jgi:hypothetical protein
MLTASIIKALMMEAASTSIRRNNPEDSHLHTRRDENLKSHCVLVTSPLPSPKQTFN